MKLITAFLGRTWRRLTGPACRVCRARGRAMGKYGQCAQCSERFETMVRAQTPRAEIPSVEAAVAKVNMLCETALHAKGKNGCDHQTVENAIEPVGPEPWDPLTERHESPKKISVAGALGVFVLALPLSTG